MKEPGISWFMSAKGLARCSATSIEVTLVKCVQDRSMRQMIGAIEILLACVLSLLQPLFL